MRPDVDGDDEMKRLVLTSCLAAALGCSAPPPANPVPVADAPGADPCAGWEDAICLETGPSSTLCTATSMVAEFLPAAACRAALTDLPATRDRLRELRGPCDDLVGRACAALGPQSQSCAVMRTQAPEMSPDKCRDLLAHFDDVLEQLRCFEASGEPLAADQRAALLAGDPPAFGPADAHVMLVLFSDFQCPFCKLAAAVVDQLRRRYEGRSVRLVFRQYPLDRHEYAHLAAEASLEAQAQGRFWEFHDLVFANQEALDPILLEQLAGQAGIDIAAYRAALRDGTHTAAVDADLGLGSALCVGGTPTLFLDFEQFRLDPRSPDTLYRAIDQALEAAGDTPTAESGTDAPTGDGGAEVPAAAATGTASPAPSATP
jgi:protein-disulfide isomerase